MLIHDAWLSARSWENFADYFVRRGFAVSTPEWPRKHGDVEELQKDAEALEGLGLAEIRRSLRGADPRARPAAGPDRSLLRRAGRRAAARPRPRARRGPAQPCAAQGDPRALPLPASKGQGRTLRKRPRQELGRKGIRINSVSPGQVETDLWLRKVGDAATVGRATGVDPAAVLEQAIGNPLGRFSKPEEVATLVALLASAPYRERHGRHRRHRRRTRQDDVTPRHAFQLTRGRHLGRDLDEYRIRPL
jgi:Enoyl-(Acyl carrier protein) reductase